MLPTVAGMAEPVVGAPPRKHVLTAVEFDVLWEHLALGPTPVVLRLGAARRTHAERRAVLAAGWDGMRSRGLADEAGPAPELARLLRLLARPARQLELRAVHGRSVRAIAASRPDAGVLAVRQDGSVTLEPCRSLPAALVGVLPVAPTGWGRAATLPTASLAAALGGPPARMRAALLAGGVAATEASLLCHMLHGVTGRAQVAGLIADRFGVLARVGGVVGVLDGPRGRYLLTRCGEWSTVAPTDPRSLRRRVAELLTAPSPPDTRDQHGRAAHEGC